mmetsp:Transcript_24550/g.53412  ORF Transcript_24550/g.53412 Transcript_24550/m.53412 type:complete len:367 (+) Transcript_24550:34-1134(+)
MSFELVPNPDGCSAFEANPFKKDKCKQCGRPWNEHKDVIDTLILEEFRSAILQKEHDEKQRQDEAARLEKEKKMMKKKAKSADEDQWYMETEDVAVEHDSDDDEEGGFQMISPAALASKKPSRGQDNHRTSIKALIDFGECDVGPEDSAPPAGSSSSAAPAISSSAQPASLIDDFAGPTEFLGDGGDAVGTQDLVAEVELLQQQLNDMREEKQIEMEICKEELAIKDDEITSLRQQCEEMKASLRQAEEELENLRNEASAQAAATTAEEEIRSREETLIAALTAAEARAEAEAAAAAAARQELSQLRASQSARQPPSDAATSAEAYAAARQITLQATDAFREIRKNAEQQMAWLRKFLPPEQDLVA